MPPEGCELDNDPDNLDGAVASHDHAELAAPPLAGSAARHADCRSANTGAAATAALHCTTSAVTAQAVPLQKLTSEDWNTSAHRVDWHMLLAWDCGCLNA